MNICGCKLGGPTCGACKARAEQAKMLVSLSARIVKLEEAVLSQGKVIEAMHDVIKSLRSMPPIGGDK